MTSKGTILVVEDTPASLKLLMDTLTGEGYQILPADSGELALAAVAARSPELILLDIHLPGLDGFEVFRRLKARLETHDIPVLMLSASVEVSERVRALKLGVVDFIIKPFHSEELLARVQTHLELGRMRVRLEQQAGDLQRANEQLQGELAGHQRTIAALAATDQEMQASRSAALNLMDDAVEARNRMEAANQALRSEIVERKRAEEALLALSRRQTAILAAVPDIIMEVDNRHVYTWANQAGFAFFGDDVIGKEAAFYFEGEQTTYQSVQPLFNGSQDVICVESWQRRKDGEKRLLAWSCRMLTDERGNVTGALSSARDITEQRRVETALRESEARYRALVETTFDWIWEVNAEGCYTYASPKAQDILGYAPEELVGRTPFDLMPEAEARRVGAVFAEIAAQRLPFAALENFNRHKDGRLVVLETSGVPVFGPGGEYRGYRGMDRDITERKRADEALRESEAQFRAMFELASIGMAQADPRSGQWLRVNQKMCAITGYSAEEMLQMRVPEITHPEDRQEDSEAFQRVVRGEAPDYRLEKRYVRKDGAITWVNVNMTVIRDAAGQPLRTMATIEDITERKRVGEALQKSEVLYRSLFENMLNGFAHCQMLFEQGQPRDFVYLAVNSAFEKLTGLKDVVGKRVSEVIPGIRETDPDLFERYGRVVRTGVPERFELWIEALKMWFDVGVYRPSPDHFVAVFDVVTERKRAELALRESRAFLEKAQQVAHFGSWSSGLSAEAPLIWSREVYRICGVTEGEFDGRVQSFYSLVHPEDRERVQQASRAATQHGVPYELDHRVVRPDGAVRWVHETAEIIRDAAGQPLRMLGVIQDISERKRVEETLEQERTLLRTLVDLLPTLIFVKDREGRFLVANAACARHMSVASPRELIGKTDAEFYPPQTAASFRLDDLGVLKGIPVVDKEDESVSPSGTRRIILTSKVPLRDGDGNIIGLVGVSLDITERKRVEEALRQREAELNEAQRVAHVGNWVWEPEADAFTWSEEVYRIYGLDPRPGPPRMEKLRQMFTPESWARLKPARENALQTGASYELDLELVRPDGMKAWVNVRGEAVRDASGRVARLRGTTHGITERKRVEQALRESEERHRAIVRTALDGFWRVDLQGRLLEVNEAYCRMSGYSEQELLAMRIADLEVVETPADTAARIQRILAQREERFESRHRRKDGSIFAVEASVQGKEAESGYMVAFLKDITERKRAEEALRASEERFRRAVVDSPFPILLHAEDGTILQASNSWCEITGYTREEIATVTDWTERAYGERKALAQGDFDRLYGLERQIAEGDHTIRIKDGSTRIWEFSSAPLGRLPDARRLVISMAMDVTERRQAEAEVRALNAELEQRVAVRTAQLETANHELEAFAYSVSHDLRSPLRGIDGWSQALLEDYAPRLDERGREYLHTVRAEAQRMGQLIDDLLRLSRVTRTEMEREALDLSELARGLADELRRGEPARVVEFVIAPGATASGDPKLLRIALQNLLANAWKFTAKHAQARIEFGAVPREGQMAFFVRDDGAGFDMQFAKKLFGPFQRLHKASEFAGTGVGLATVQRIIHRHGGRVWAEAAVGQGATFYFTLPAL